MASHPLHPLIKYLERFGIEGPRHRREVGDGRGLEAADRPHHCVRRREATAPKGPTVCTEGRNEHRK